MTHDRNCAPGCARSAPSECGDEVTTLEGGGAANIDAGAIVPPMPSRPLVVYVDVDDTLIRSIGTKRIPLPAVIRYVRTLHQSGGAILYCWSAGGAEYAEATARELGIEACFRAFLPKPDLVIDDQPFAEWRDLTVVHPNNCN